MGWLGASGLPEIAYGRSVPDVDLHTAQQIATTLGTDQRPAAAFMAVDSGHPATVC
jgi:hypothetical protein